MKYTVESTTQLWETVKIRGKYYLVSYYQLQKMLYADTLVDNAESEKVYPFAEDGTVEHYNFDRFDELQQCVQTAV